MRATVLALFALLNIISALPQISFSEDPVRQLLGTDPANPHALDVDEERLLWVMGDPAPTWRSEGDKMRLRRAGKRFRDVTDYRSSISANQVALDDTKWPDITHGAQTVSIFSALSKDRMHDSLARFTSFFTRDYKSEYGRMSSHWLYLRVLDIIANAPPHLKLSLRKFSHPFPQSTVIARFEPIGPNNSSSPVVIIGAHQDSLNYLMPSWRSPGADDDGSGTVTILEAFHALVENGFKPEIPVEFHWYAGEEGGLLGSQAVAQDYLNRHVQVKAMVQFDMTAYVKKNAEPTLTLITTDVTKSLTDWTMDLASKYSTIKVQGAKLFPGAGSDHMSYYTRGYSSCFATEGDPMHGRFDPYIHTARDRMDIPEFDFGHALEFAKLAVAFAVELGSQKY